MRILYTIPTLGHGGAERQLSYLAAELSARGHEVHVASSRGGVHLARMRSAGVEWHRLGGAGHRDPVIFYRLLRLMRKLRPDVVQTILTPADIMGGAAALLTRTRWVLRESSSAPLYASGLRHRVRLALARMADAVVSNSAGGEAYWRSAKAAPPLYVIPNAVPLDEIAAGPGSATAAGLGFGAGAKVVLYAGRMDEGKNVEGVIAALARVAPEAPFVALMCGDGPSRPRLERMTRELGIDHRVVFKGYVDNLWDLMRRADALVSLSRFEGCPNVVLEAMACGCPLVVSDIPAHRELLDERSARFADPDDTAKAAAELKATLTSGDGGRARAARARAAGRPVGATARLYEQVYKGLLGEAWAARLAEQISDSEAA
ncbi:MAG TPA: glycosyltransferase [Pyrinomonadaceae bacterium]|jgi:glycosyltransferase involved in cell wall biosynthesis